MQIAPFSLLNNHFERMHPLLVLQLHPVDAFRQILGRNLVVDQISVDRQYLVSEDLACRVEQAERQLLKGDLLQFQPEIS